MEVVKDKYQSFLDADESPNEDLIRTLNEALYFAGAAYQFDSANEVHLSCEQYDKSILYIDEVLGKISCNAVQYSRLLLLRNSYDDRLEFLRHYDGLKADLKPLDKARNFSSYQSKRISHRIFKDDERLLDCLNSDDCPSRKLSERRPESVIKLPFWQLRFIHKSIKSGSFLTPSVFIPANVWSQTGVKFCGLSIKTSAFQAIITMIKDVDFIDDENSDKSRSSASLTVFLSLLNSTYEGLIVMQNQLSKPFLFIKEVPHDESSKSNVIKGQVI